MDRAMWDDPRTPGGAAATKGEAQDQFRQSLEESSSAVPHTVFQLLAHGAEVHRRVGLLLIKM